MKGGSKIFYVPAPWLRLSKELSCHVFIQVYLIAESLIAGKVEMRCILFQLDDKGPLLLILSSEELPSKEIFGSEVFFVPAG